MRAGVFHALGERHVFAARVVPALRQALCAEEPTVEETHSRLHGRPLATAFALELPWRERLRRRRAAASRRLESLPAVWLAFALTLKESYSRRDAPLAALIDEVTEAMPADEQTRTRLPALAVLRPVRPRQPAKHPGDAPWTARA
jgi:hypothetical protein